MKPLTLSQQSYTWFDEHFGDAVRLEAIRAIRDERLSVINDQRFKVYCDALMHTPDASATKHLKLDAGLVEIGAPGEMQASEHERLLTSLRAFCPWKKGPFSFFGTEIDAEWRSDWKWQRVRPVLGDLAGKRICDVGCHNGYFMFRLAAENPGVVVGVEPVLKHQLAFELIQTYAQVPRLVFEPLGVEDLDLYPKFFDCILMLGILYHHTDPVGLLRKTRDAMAPGAQLVVDCQGIPGSEPVALVPQGRYAGASGIWFLPSQKALEHWLLRAGFRNIDCFFAEPLSVKEQRPTAWADIKSLQDALTPDRQQTVEGYPAPWRFYVRCQK